MPSCSHQAIPTPDRPVVRIWGELGPDAIIPYWLLSPASRNVLHLYDASLCPHSLSDPMSFASATYQAPLELARRIFPWRFAYFEISTILLFRPLGLITTSAGQSTLNHLLLCRGQSPVQESA